MIWAVVITAWISGYMFMMGMSWQFDRDNIGWALYCYVTSLVSAGLCAFCAVSL